MKINDYILTEIKPFTLSNTIKDAQDFCKYISSAYILIVENNRYLGCFLKDDIMIIEKSQEKLASLQYLLQYFHAYIDDSYLELLRVFADNDTNIIPILDKKQDYIGYYELGDVLAIFTNSPFFYDNSELLIIEKPKTTFTMSEITQIVEANNSKLLGCFISLETEKSIQVTLKVITNELNELIQTLRRYEYHVISKHPDDEYLEELKNRSEYLQKYLNM